MWLGGVIVAAALVGGAPWWWPWGESQVPELTGATTSPAPGSGPLEVSVEPWLFCPYSAGWLLPGYSGELPKVAGAKSPDDVRARAGQRLTTGEPLDDWLEARGAVATFGTWINVNLRGASAKAVRIEDVQVTVLRRRPEVKGAPFLNICGGTEISVFNGQIDLDRLKVGRPTSLPKLTRSGQGELGENPDESLPIPFSVSESDLATIAIWAKAGRYDHDWVADIIWTDGARKGKTRITAGDGRPFRLTGFTGVPN